MIRQTRPAEFESFGDRMSGIRDSRIGTWARQFFREAPAVSAKRNLTRTFLQSVVFWGVLLWVVPVALGKFERGLGSEPFSYPTQAWTPWLLFAAAGSLGIWSAISMAILGEGTPLPVEAPRRLVVGGPYRFVRNPMAVAGLTQGASVGLFLGSYMTLVYVIAGGLLWNYAVRPIEEADLEDRFGEDFVRYRREVRCWIPKVTPYASD